MRTARTFVFPLFLFCLIPALTGAQVYTIRDLGPLTPTAINSWAQVVGNYNNHAYMWTRKGGMQDLGILQGGTFSGATGINDLGAVTGTADGPGTVISNDPNFSNEDCGDLIQPFIWTQRNGMQGLGSVTPPAGLVDFEDGGCADDGYYGAGINDVGQAVGYSTLYSTYQWASLWTRAHGLTVFGGSWPPTFTNAISNTGKIVGQNSQDTISPLTIFLGHATSWQNGVAADLGTLGGTADMGFPVGYSSSANGVNDLGQIVGWSTTVPVVFQGGEGWYGPYPLHAILWPTSGGMRDLGTLPGDQFSTASKINLFGQVIGVSGNANNLDSYNNTYQVIGRPFIWSERHGMRDLNTLIRRNHGWVLNSATDINVWGQIVGMGTLNGQPHGFLLTPRDPFRP